MSYLVPDFLINPVLRQARRFSRSSQPVEPEEPTSSHPRAWGRTHGVAIEDIAERLEGLDALRDEAYDGTEILSEATLTASPTTEDGGLEAELESRSSGSASALVGARHSLSGRRLMPLRSEPEQVDEDVSDNPLFGIPGQFRTESTTGAVLHDPNHIILAARMSPAEGPSRRPTIDSMNSGSNSHHRDSPLPEDDGMGALRQKIITVQSMEISSEQKARLMHDLLTKGHLEAQEIYHPKQQRVEASPVDMISQERPTPQGSLTSFIWQMNGIEETPVAGQHYTFHLSPSDLKATYAPLDPPEIDEDGDIAIKDTVQVLGCQHYRRNVKLQCTDCERWYTCRLCHDEVEDHILNRKATKNMLCMVCGCAQRAGEFCVSCGERTAWYYCGVCKLWDNDPNKNIYHCHDCGICRKGRGLGKDFFHCKTCGTCMSMAVEHSHKCIERVSDCDCPICGEYMFTSPSPVVFMLCGHGIHKACYDEHMKSSYKCPICSKSMVNMETQFRNLDRAIDSQPMPPQFQDTKAMVSCNDCYAKSAVKYHWLGLKCAICDSYNTAQLSILSDPAVEVPAVESRETESHTPVDQLIGDAPSSSTLVPGTTRSRRHSSHVHPPTPVGGVSRRFEPYPVIQRIGRSVSPTRGPGFFEVPVVSENSENDGSRADEVLLDFWGRDEPPNNVDENLEPDEDMADEEDDDSEDSSSTDDGEEEDIEEMDRFELFGHR